MKIQCNRVTILAILLLIPSFNLLGYTGQIIKSFNTPGTHPTGLTFDGQNLWMADRKTKKLYCINTETGKVIRTIPSPGYWPMGLTWDGEALWNADVKGGLPMSENYRGKIYRIDPSDGTILKTLESPSGTPRGLTWDGDYLWCLDNHKDKLIRFSPFDGTTIDEFPAPAKEPHGLTFDGNYLWSTDRLLDEIHMIDPNTGKVILITPSPGPFPRGICYDGEFIWCVDYQKKKIYQLKCNDGVKMHRSNPHLGKASFVHQTTNFGPGVVKHLDVHFAIPKNRDNQEIIDAKIIFNPEYSDLQTDQWGQKTAHFIKKDIKPNTRWEITMNTRVKTWNTRYLVFPELVGSLSEIPDSITNLYIEDNEKYQITHPIIQDALEKAVGTEDNPYWIARKIYDYLIPLMHYEMDGGWNTAPTVLARGSGSCSEYSFVYISMCRAAGLPARYVGSYVIRGDDSCMDDVFHRWVEVYLPNYGWIPVDPSGGDKKLPRDQANYFGFVSNRFLITTQSGGASNTMGWTYNCNQFWKTTPKTNVVFDYFGEWEPLKR